MHLHFEEEVLFRRSRIFLGVLWGAVALRRPLKQLPIWGREAGTSEVSGPGDIMVFLFSLVSHLPTVWQTFLQLLDMESYRKVTAEVKVRWSGRLSCNISCYKFLLVLLSFLLISVIVTAPFEHSLIITHTALNSLSVHLHVVRNDNGLCFYWVNRWKHSLSILYWGLNVCVACWDIFSYWMDLSPGGT